MEEKQTTAHAPGCVFCSVIAPQVQAFVDHLWPENTREHFRNARVEWLKGVRSILDAKIEHLSQHPQKGTKLTVE
jgi:hypothetical protein